MRKLILGVSALALMSTAALAGDDKTRTTGGMEEDSQMSTAKFTELDSDGDGRVSAIEASNDSKVAAHFTTADADKDGYLSRSEFSQMAAMSSERGSSRQASAEGSRSSSDDDRSSSRSESRSSDDTSSSSDTLGTAPQPR